MKKFGIKRPARNPYLTIVIGFLVLILLGCLLLLLPISTKEGISFVDALFMSASAVCITGLSTVSVFSTFTVFGKVVLCLLMQVGGLGIITVAMAVFAMLGAKLGLSEKFLVSETLGSTPQLDFRKFLFRAILISAVAELIGFLINLIALCGDYSGGELVGVSIFHAVSSFNNAGLDIFGENSLIPFRDNVLLLLNTSALTIFGGLGFLVINEILGYRPRKNRRLSVHTKLVLVVTAGLLLLGTLAIFFTEWGKIDFLNAFFMSSMTRTCGFSSSDLGSWSEASLLLADVLMFIGAAPASTGGGIKLTTFFIVLAAGVSFVRGKPVVVFGRRIDKDSVSRALIVSSFALALVLGFSFVLAAIESDLTLSEVVTETVSAFANVGLSTGVTSSLHTASKILLIIAMFMGRIGFVTVLMVMKKRWNVGEDESIRYVKADILIG